MTNLLVKRRDIEHSPPAGSFADRRVGGGLLPSAALSALGTFCVNTDARVFSLTYDDGPDPASTPGVLDMLAVHESKATFFVLAEPARAHPEIVRRMVHDGHEVALHGITHRSLLTMAPREAARQISDGRKTVEDITGRAVKLYRPPYGSHNLRHAWSIHRLGLELTIWSGDAFDWVDDHEEKVAQRAISAVFPGAIVLLHDTRADPETLGPGERLPAIDRAVVLDQILRFTTDAGYTTMTAGALMATYPRVKSIARERMSIDGVG